MFQIIHFDVKQQRQISIFSQKMQNVLAIYRQLIYTEKELRKFKEKRIY